MRAVCHAATLLALLCHVHTAEAQLNAADYGAVGDGEADDAPALQRAIDAAQKQGATLSLSNGSYALSTMLSVGGEPLRLVGGGVPCLGAHP